jgi:tRNA(Ile2) C34 agmatinyltransferase TiaS
MKIIPRISGQDENLRQLLALALAAGVTSAHLEEIVRTAKPVRDNACPECQTPLVVAGPDRQRCPHCGVTRGRS